VGAEERLAHRGPTPFEYAADNGGLEPAAPPKAVQALGYGRSAHAGRLCGHTATIKTQEAGLRNRSTDCASSIESVGDSPSRWNLQPTELSPVLSTENAAHAPLEPLASLRLSPPRRQLISQRPRQRRANYDQPRFQRWLIRRWRVPSLSPTYAPPSCGRVSALGMRRAAKLCTAASGLYEKASFQSI
jgi:hypothetical protein